MKVWCSVCNSVVCGFGLNVCCYCHEIISALSEGGFKGIDTLQEFKEQVPDYRFRFRCVSRYLRLQKTEVLISG